MTTRTCQDNPLPTGCFLSAECSKENSKLSYLLRPLVRLVDGGMPPVCDRPHGNRRTVFPSFFTGGQIGCSNGSKSSGSNSCSLARSSCHAPKPGEGDATPPTTPSVETPTAAAAAFAAAPAFLSDASIFPAGAKANDDARARAHRPHPRELRQLLRCSGTAPPLHFDAIAPIAKGGREIQTSRAFPSSLSSPPWPS